MSDSIRTASRRKDAFESPHVSSRARRRRFWTTKTASTDCHGRFVGLHDLERGLRFFWDQPHRRAAAPIVRGDAVFGRGGPLAHQPHHGSRGVPRSLAKSGLDFAKLRDIHARYANGNGEAKAVLAREYDVSVNVVTFHLRPSCSMRAALAEQPAPGNSHLRAQISAAPLVAPSA